MDDFRGAKAVITGAGSGIGRALAQALCRAGCQLYLSDINETTLAETHDSLSNPDAASIARVDVADRDAVLAWAAAVSAATDTVDLLVNNAGVALIASAQATSRDDFRWLMDINFWGVVNGSEAFLPLLERGAGGTLINVSSVFGMIGVPTQAAYNASKFAVRGYTEALRQDLALAGSPVRVCCVQPGGVGTNIARSGRNADPSVTGQQQHEAFLRHVRTSAEDAAATILRGAARGRPRILIGPDARFVDWLVRLFPVSYPRVLRRLLDEREPPP